MEYTSLMQSTTFWVSVSSLIFVVVAYIKAKHIIISKLDDRIRAIKDDIHKAESLRLEAQDILARYERRHQVSMEESEKIINNAKENAADIKKYIEDETNRIIEGKEQQLSQRLNRMRSDMMKEINTETAALAAQATLSLLEENLDKKVNTELLNETIATLPKKLSA